MSAATGGYLTSFDGLGFGVWGLSERVLRSAAKLAESGPFRSDQRAMLTTSLQEVEGPAAPSRGGSAWRHVSWSPSFAGRIMSFRVIPYGCGAEAPHSEMDGHRI